MNGGKWQLCLDDTEGLVVKRAGRNKQPTYQTNGVAATLEEVRCILPWQALRETGSRYKHANSEPIAVSRYKMSRCCTLLQSTLDAPFIHYFNYTPEQAPDSIITSPGAPVKFNASVSAQQYASGGTSRYQKPFFIVLFGVFGLNVMALLYFGTHKTWYVDFSEPPNLFSLAVNSPPSEAFSGCCGTGPSGKDYGVSWTLEQDQGHVFVHSGPRHESSEGSGVEGAPVLKKRKVWRTVSESPVMKGIGRMGTWRRGA